MKILQLNVWNGRIKGELLRFFERNDFDVICMQEVTWGDDEAMLEFFTATLGQIRAASGLGYASQAANLTVKACRSKVAIGNVILSREKIIDERIEEVHGKCKTAKNADSLHNHGYTAQLVKLQSGLNVVNYHGYWLPTPVGDETTTAVMRKVAKMIHGANGPLVMCGDLNIVHAAPAMRELDFLRDLTEEYGVDNTLNGLKFDGKVACDHILVNEQVEVKSFEVLEDIVSDHKALVAEVG